MTATNTAQFNTKLIRHGIILFLLGLLTGLVIPLMENTRMGLSSHLEAVLNGMFLMLLGIVWHKLDLSPSLRKWGCILALFGAYTNWLTTFLAAMWGAGAALMPIAGGTHQGTFWQETLIKLGLGTLSISMIAVCIIVLLGLRDKPSAP